MDCATDAFLLLLTVAMVTTPGQAAVETVKAMGDVGAPKEMCLLASKTEKKDTLTAYVQVRGSSAKLAITFSLADCDSDILAKVRSCALAEEGRSDAFNAGATPFLFKGQKLVMECTTHGGATIKPIEQLAAIAKMGKAGAAAELCGGKQDSQTRKVIIDVAVRSSESKAPNVQIPIILSIACLPAFSGVAACYYWKEGTKDINLAQPNDAKTPAIFEHNGKTYKLTCETDKGATIEKH